MNRILLIALLCSACGQPSPDPTPEPSAATATSSEGWGAVFWREDVAWKVGGGDTVVGPRSLATSRPRADTPTKCGGVAVDDAVPHAVLALPAGKSGDTPAKPAVITAAVVETAAWRLDEVLPARDRYAPATPETNPALQRGVAVGSVVKVRRFGGPPVLAVGGSRDCTGVLALLDREATQVLARITVPDMCGTPRVLPPADIDGDGQLETALFTDTHILLARLPFTSANVAIEPLQSWTCPLADESGG